MPNDTDFTNFTAQGYSGLNFANLESLYYYHNHNDNFSNINADTMRQYGDNLYPMLREFTTNAAYSDVNWAKAGSDSTAFSILPGGVMIAYSNAVGMILLAAMLLAVAVMLVFRNFFLKASRNPLQCKGFKRKYEFARVATERFRADRELVFARPSAW